MQGIFVANNNHGDQRAFRTRKLAEEFIEQAGTRIPHIREIPICGFLTPSFTYLTIFWKEWGFPGEEVYGAVVGKELSDWHFWINCQFTSKDVGRFDIWIDQKHA